MANMTQLRGGGVKLHEFEYQCIFNEASIELKGKDKNNNYINKIWLILENMQLVDSTTIMHVVEVFKHCASWLKRGDVQQYDHLPSLCSCR